jgi:hypothetical protein
MLILSFQGLSIFEQKKKADHSPPPKIRTQESKEIAFRCSVLAVGKR